MSWKIAVPVSEAPPVDVSAGSQTAQGAQPVRADGGSVQPTPAWPYQLPVMFAPPWAVDEMIRVEEYWQDGTLVVRGEMPGIDPEKDVRLTVENGRLAIEAERHEEGEVEREGLILSEAALWDVHSLIAARRRRDRVFDHRHVQGRTARGPHPSRSGDLSATANQDSNHHVLIGRASLTTPAHSHGDTSFPGEGKACRRCDSSR
jgi:hypothetical protein